MSFGLGLGGAQPGLGDARIIVRAEICILTRSFVRASREHSDSDID